MWGPVVIDPNDKFFCNCAIASNNTGELCGMLNALLWAKRQGGEEAFAICYDSKYAKNITTGIWKPRKNTSIGQLCNRLFREEQQRRVGGVHFIHAKGHSGDDGNDHADDRVQWGKGDGPYCRFALHSLGSVKHKMMSSHLITNTKAANSSIVRNGPFLGGHSLGSVKHKMMSSHLIRYTKAVNIYRLQLDLARPAI